MNWAKRAKGIEDCPPCLVYVTGTRGIEPQVWYEPMVDDRGNAKVTTQIVGKPVQLPADQSWTPESAEAYVLREAKRAKNAA